MATRMQQRRGTAAQWTGANPILAAGEIGFESDTNQFKIGDGVNHWEDLSYFKNLEDLGGSLDDYILLTQKGSANGVATLDGNGQVPVSQLGNIIDGAPGVLDTLNELAAAIGDNADFASTVATHVSDTSAHGVTGDVVGTTDTQTLTNKTISGASNTLSNIAQSSVTNLTTDLSALDGRLDTAEGTLVTLGNTTTTLSEDLATANEDIANLETDKAPLNSPTFTGTVTLPTGTVTSAMISNGTIINEDISSSASISQSKIADLTSDLAAKAPTESPTFTGTVAGITKTMVGLGNVDNTSDALKPVSTATQTALDAKAPKASPTFTGTLNAADVIISGDLTVSGTTTTVDTQDLVVTDPMIYMGDGNSGNLVDLGIVSSFNDGTYQHTGLVRDASEGKWKLFKGVTDEPTATVNFTQGSLDSLAVGALEASSLTVGSVSNTEIGYLDGVTSAIQTQIDTKAPISSPTFTGTVTLPTGTVTSGMILDGTIVNADINASAAIALSN